MSGKTTKRSRFNITLMMLLALGLLSFLVAGHLLPQQVGNSFGLLKSFAAYGYTVWVMVLAIVLLRSRERSQGG